MIQGSFSPIWMLGTLMLVSGLALWYVWWMFPGFAARRKGIDDKKHTADVEDAYRKAIAQAIGSIAIAGALLLTWEQYSTTAEAQSRQLALQSDQLELARKQFSATSESQSKSQQLEQYQKAFELLNVDQPASHVGAIFGLELLARAVPDLQEAITRGLSAAAVRFSYASHASRGTVATQPIEERIAPDAEAALQIIGRTPNPSGIAYPLGHGRFRGASLVHLYFQGATLEGSDLSGSDLYLSSFYGANLFGSNLNGASAPGADFSHARLIGVTACRGMNRAVSSEMDGKEKAAGFASATFYSARLDRVWFPGALLTGARFDNAVLVGAHLEYSDLRQATFVSAQLQSARFDHADVRNVVFEYKDNGADSNGVDATNMLRYASFEGANLAQSAFKGMDLRSVNFSRANLRDTQLPTVRIADSNAANWKQARFCNTRFSDGTRSDHCGVPEPGGRPETFRVRGAPKVCS